MNDSEFPEYFTIDDIGLHSLNEYLKDEFENETVLIKVVKESDVTEEDKQQWLYRFVRKGESK